MLSCSWDVSCWGLGVVCFQGGGIRSVLISNASPGSQHVSQSSQPEQNVPGFLLWFGECSYGFSGDDMSVILVVFPTNKHHG